VPNGGGSSAAATDPAAANTTSSILMLVVSIPPQCCSISFSEQVTVPASIRTMYTPGRSARRSSLIPGCGLWCEDWRVRPVTSISVIEQGTVSVGARWIVAEPRQGLGSMEKPAGFAVGGAGSAIACPALS
jgi:hypothetical protein